MIGTLNTLLLTLDTSQGVTSLAVSAAGRVVADHTDTTPSHQATALLPAIQRMMKQAGIGWQDLDGIACTTGPGGFTSVRIGVATARGLAFAAGKPVQGVSLPALMAWYAFQEHGVRDITCLLPAGHRDMSTQSFHGKADTLRPIDTMTLVPREAFMPDPARTYCVLAPLFPASPTIFMYPLQETARLLGALLHHQGTGCYEPPTPLYARPPDAVAGKPLLS
jgi:tRNA threonylcarbamoyladenosine biosynthesis protein TsaB